MSCAFSAMFVSSNAGSFEFEFVSESMDPVACSVEVFTPKQPPTDVIIVILSYFNYSFFSNDNNSYYCYKLPVTLEPTIDCIDTTTTTSASGMAVPESLCGDNLYPTRPVDTNESNVYCFDCHYVCKLHIASSYR